MNEIDKIKVKNAKLLKDHFHKSTITPLAHVIWERDEIRDRLRAKKRGNKSWLSKLNKQTTKIAYEIDEKKVDAEKLEDQLIATASMCLVWIEKLREQTKKKKEQEKANKKPASS